MGVPRRVISWLQTTGIADLFLETFRMAHAQLYQSSNASATTPDDTTSFKEAVFSGTTFDTATAHDFDSPATGRLRYTGTRPAVLHVACSVAFTTTDNNQIVHLRLGKNGSFDDRGEVQRKVGTAGDIGSTALHAIYSVSNGDYVSLGLRNESSTGDVTITDINLQAVGMRT